MMSRFFRRLGSRSKKDADRARAGSRGHKAPSPALAKPSEARRPFASGLHRRDLDQDQHDPALRLGAARRAARRQGPARPLEDRDLPGRAAQRPHRRALPVRRPHQRRALSRLRRTVPRPDPQAQRHRRARQSRLAQGKGGAKRDQGRRRASPVPAQILTRPQSDRAGLRQAQRLRAKSRAPNPRRRLRRHRQALTTIPPANAQTISLAQAMRPPKCLYSGAQYSGSVLDHHSHERPQTSLPTVV